VIITGMKSAAETAVNRAVGDFLSENPDAGQRLAKVITSESGTVSAITTDPAAVNFVKTEVSARAQKIIDQLAREEGLSVPIGSFTGLAFLSAAGPQVRMAVESRSTVSCRFKSSFDSAGINQTVHHVVLVVNVAITVVNPFRIKEAIAIASDYEIAQTVIVGSVPSYSGVITY
jgi:sporulation protein YunB